MPEYLAPGVYVEEIDTGSKPIEGVSTSTAAMVGVTERGPVGVPVLVTSFGEYDRIFGGRLSAIEFGARRHLPFAVEGFFTNGGKRLFVVRVLDDTAATRAAFTLHSRGEAGQVETALLRASAEGDGGAGSQLLVLDGGSLSESATQPVRFGDGSTAEYRFVTEVRTVAEADPNHVPLHLPLAGSYDGNPVRQINPVAVDLPSTNPLTLTAAAARGADQVRVTATAADDLDTVIDATALQPGDLVRIGDASTGEYRFVTAVTVPDAATPTEGVVDLDVPLTLAHAAADGVVRLDPAPTGADEIDTDTLDGAARANDRVVFVVDRNGNFDTAGTLLAIRDLTNTATLEVRRIGDLQQLTLARAVGAALGAGTVVEGVTLTDDATARTLTRAATAGGLAVTLDVRSGLAEGGVIRIGDEYAVVDALPDQAAGGDDPGTVRLSQGLQGDHALGEDVRGATVAPTASRPTASTLFDAPSTGVTLAVSDGSVYTADEVVRLTAPNGDTWYAALAENADDLDPRLVEVSVPLTLAHSAGDPVAERNALLAVEALDAGAWGNRVRVSVEDEAVGLLASTTLATVVSGNQVRLGTYGGVEAGTVLELLDPVTGATVDELLKVTHVNRVNGTITLAAPLTAGHLAAIAALPPGSQLRVRSREFRITVRLYRPPDPAVPTRNETVLDTEIFRYLSMDPRHSNYVETILGAVDGPLRRWDRRPEGSSRYVRVDDRGAAGGDAVLQGIRLGPETLLDVLPRGNTRAARHPLSGGNDSLGTLVDDSYVGVDALEPDDRTGLH
ncbi:MAG TPA: hypothetical protein VM890_16515, partial [Longimicrobium sp.]|nr:hypothetical protein [Longimicrobium sp.]